MGHLVNHFFSDITHFDGKFFSTVKDLVIKPGFLSKEYIRGRRASYLDPVRMYVFTSAFFFLMFFSVYSVKNIHFGEHSKQSGHSTVVLDSALAQAGTPEDSALIRKALGVQKDAPVNITIGPASSAQSVNITGLNGEYNSAAQYDSAQRALPAKERDGWIERSVMRKNAELRGRYRDNKADLIKEWIGSFLHHFPKMLFISLPVFALILKLLYIRRKQFYYVDHGIFSLHLYIFSFLVLLIFLGTDQIREMAGWGWIGWIETLLILFSLGYYYKAMRNFYGQGRFKTIMKYGLLCLSSFLVFLMLFLGFFLFSFFEV
ncbi:MAG TPA: DUF3667 domain-containing protein [Puia sp.]|nr:DUF3667 domain-containing protein [Puia sp.]